MSNLLEYKNYHGAIEFSEEDNMLIGHVIGVNDSLNFHGFSVDEITQSFHDCIDGYLEMCQALGRRPDKEYKGTFNVRITPELHRQAAIAAEKAGKTLNQFVQDAIQSALSADTESERITYIVCDQQLAASYALTGQFSPNLYNPPVSIPS